jgi:UDP-glucose 4-epimerase
MSHRTGNLRQYSWRQEFGDQFSGRRVMVTGARGFVGSCLREVSLSLGAKVYGTKTKTSSHNEVDGVRFVTVDLRDQQAAKEMVEASNPDFTYHLAALVDTCQRVDLALPTLQHNLVGTLHLLTASLDRQCQRTVVAGSSETPPHGRAPNAPYDASMLALIAYAEMFHTLYGLPVVVAHPKTPYLGLC